MITYIIQVVLFQVVFLAVYDFFLSKETFYKYNRAYLLGTPIASFVLPLIKIPTFQRAVPEEVMIFLPEIMLSPQKVIEQTSFYTKDSLNYISIIFWSGLILFSIAFVIKLIKVIQLILANETIQKPFYKLVLLPNKKNAFSFFNYIFLGKDISEEKQGAIVKHELVHSKQRHTLDLLFFEFLRIIMWFNPLVYVYQKRITLLHEYISDAEVVKTTEKTIYFNKLLSQAFEVENISFVNQFYKHSFIKKRITMMTKNKSSQIKKVKYLLLLPLLASMLLYTSCNTDGTSNSESQEVEKLRERIAYLEKTNKYQKEELHLLKKNSDLLHEKNYTENGNLTLSNIEEPPVFPGCTGSREEKIKCLNSGVRKLVMENFNAGMAKNLKIKKGINKIWVIFKIDKKGEVTDIRARAPHPKLKEEAVRVAGVLPKMKAGKQSGKPVGVMYTLPISFNVE